jgi:dephospho-CoA kinase
MTVYVTTGLPGAGKTEVAELLEEFTSGQMYSTGDIVRGMFRQETEKEKNSQELADFAAEKRKELGPAFAIEWLIDNEPSGDPLIVDGVRHIEEVRELRAEYDDVTVIWTAAPFEIRYNRVVTRGREGEAEFSRDDFSERDKNELYNLGTQSLLDNNAPDERIENDGSYEDLETAVQRIL